MRKTLKFLCIGALSILAFGVYNVYFEIGSKNFTYSVDASFILSEETAVRYSRMAIIDAGIDINQLTPEKWGPPDSSASEKIFARNTISSNSGYVLWGYKGEELPRKGYSVHLMHNESIVTVSLEKYK